MVLFSETEEQIFQQTVEWLSSKFSSPPAFIKQSVNGFHLDPFARTFNNEDGNIVYLTAKEFDLLYYFVTNPNRLINKTTLAESVWGDNIDQADSLDFIYSQVKNLRKKMKTADAIPEIKAVYGFGYKLITTPEV